MPITVLAQSLRRGIHLIGKVGTIEEKRRPADVFGEAFCWQVLK